MTINSIASRYKRIRRNSWPSTFFLELDEKDYYKFCGSHETFQFKQGDVLATDWELYEDKEHGMREF